MTGTSDDKSAFRAELDQMTERLVAAERRAHTLAELNRLLAQGRDPLEFAQRAVDLVMRASGAGGTFVYLWDAERERLVLRVARTGSQAAHVDEIELRLGEGVTGWSALMRQTVVIHDDLRDDPRFVAFPLVDEDHVRSIVAVPIVVAGGDLLGVFSVWSSQSSAFGPYAVDLATEVGGLLASGLVQARTVDDLRRQSAAASFLLTLPTDATSSLQRCVDVVAFSIRDQVDAALCTIELADRANADTPTRPGVAVALDVDTDVGVAARTVRSRAELVELVQKLGPGHHKYSTSFGQMYPLGVLTCLRARPFSETDVNILEALSAQVAVLVGSLANATVVAPLAARLAAASNSREAERLLHDLGWRRGLTHPVSLHIRSAQYGSPAIVDRVIGSLQDMTRGFDDVVLVPSAPSVTILVRHHPEQWKKFDQALRTVCRALRTEAGVGIAAGIGPPVSEAAQLVAALDDAETTAMWAHLTGEAVVHHQDVAHLWMLPKIAVAAGDSLREPLRRFGELVRYDMRHGTTLARTLDVYLSNRCSITDTAAALFIHRNTLRQRLARIDELTGRPFDESDDWTLISLAARLSVATDSAHFQSPDEPHTSSIAAG